jgi:glycosidase
MLSIRRKYKDLFVYGDFSLIDDAHPSIFAFERRDKHSEALVVLNRSSQNVMWDPQSSGRRIIESGRLLQTNYDRKGIELTGAGTQLLPWEAGVFISQDIV